MAKRFTKPSINWAELEKLVPPDQKGKFGAFKAKSDVYLRRVLANPPEAPKINWEEYLKKVPVDGLVEKFKQEYEKVKVPFPADPLTKTIDEQWNKLQVEIKKFNADRQKDIEGAKKELDRIDALPKFENMTMEMFLDMYPEQAFDFVKKPTFWPHTPEEQLDYVEPTIGQGDDKKTSSTEAKKKEPEKKKGK